MVGVGSVSLLESKTARMTHEASMCWTERGVVGENGVEVGVRRGVVEEWEVGAGVVEVEVIVIVGGGGRSW